MRTGHQDRNRAGKQRLRSYRVSSEIDDSDIETVFLEKSLLHPNPKADGYSINKRLTDEKLVWRDYRVGFQTSEKSDDEGCYPRCDLLIHKESTSEQLKFDGATIVPQ